MLIFLKKTKPKFIDTLKKKIFINFEINNLKINLNKNFFFFKKFCITGGIIQNFLKKKKFFKKKKILLKLLINFFFFKLNLFEFNLNKIMVFSFFKKILKINIFLKKLNTIILLRLNSNKFNLKKKKFIKKWLKKKIC